MTLNEDTAGAYASGLIREVLSRDIKTDAEGKGFGGTFNRERLAKNKIDAVFNYPNAETFTNEVLEAVKVKNPMLYNRYQNLIKNLAKEYATKKLVIRQKTTVVKEEHYFNY